MVQTDRGDGAQEGDYDVGGIDAASHTNLKDDNIALGKFVVKESNQGDYFEESQRQLESK